MTLNGVMTVFLRYFTEFGSFGGQLRQAVKDRPILSPTKMQYKESSFLAIYHLSKVK